MKISKIAACIFLLSPFFAFSQTRVEAGLMIGATNYFGELTEDFTNFQETQFGLGLMGRAYFHPLFNLRTHVYFSNISGDDIYNKTYYLRNLRFSGSLTEMALLAEFNLILPRAFKNGKIKRMPLMVPYIIGGGTFTIADVEVSDNYTDEQFIKEPFPEENDEEAFLCFLGGGGLKFYPKNGQSNVRFDLEGALIYTFSDFLDGISINGNPLDNDWYFHVELNVIYNFTKNNAGLCPKF